MVDLNDKLKKVKALKNIFDFYQNNRYDSNELSTPYFRQDLIMGIILRNKNDIEEILKYDSGFVVSDFDFGVGISYVSRARFVTGFEKFFFEITWEARRYCQWLKNGPIAQRERQ